MGCVTKKGVESCELCVLNARIKHSMNSRLTGGDLQDLGWHPNGTLDTEVLVLGLVDESLAD